MDKMRLALRQTMIEFGVINVSQNEKVKNCVHNMTVYVDNEDIIVSSSIGDDRYTPENITATEAVDHFNELYSQNKLSAWEWLYNNSVLKKI